MSSFSYEYKGIYIDVDYKKFVFDILKFDDGKYFKNMKWDTDQAGVTVNILSSIFKQIQKSDPSIISIAKKSNTRIDNLLQKAKQTDSADFSTLTVMFTAHLNGNFLARQKLELVNIGMLAKNHTRIKGLGNISIFTFQADNAIHTVTSEDEYYNSLGG